MLVLGNGNGSLLPQDVSQRSERQSRRARVKTGTDVLPLSSPSNPQKVPLNHLASIWIGLEHNGEEILITPGVTGGSRLCAEQCGDKSAYERRTPVQFNKC